VVVAQGGADYKDMRGCRKHCGDVESVIWRGVVWL